MEAWEDEHFRFDDLPAGIRARGEWTDLEKHDLSGIEYLILWHHKTGDGTFGNLPEIPALKYLEINWSTATSLEGVQRFRGLRRLELHYCTKLVSVARVCDLRGSLRHLRVDRSKKLSDHTVVTCCQGLTTLVLNDCGSLESLAFLHQLPALESFRFVDTKVIDGDLQPLIDHPALRRAGFLDKRHYSHTSRQIEGLLAEK
jgi:hypothetical protein